MRSLLEAMTRSQSLTLCFLRNFFVKYLRYLRRQSQLQRHIPNHKRLNLLPGTWAQMLLCDFFSNITSLTWGSLMSL